MDEKKLKAEIEEIFQNAKNKKIRATRDGTGFVQETTLEADEISMGQYIITILGEKHMDDPQFDRKIALKLIKNTLDEHFKHPVEVDSQDNNREKD